MNYDRRTDIYRVVSFPYLFIMNKHDNIWACLYWKYNLIMHRADNEFQLLTTTDTKFKLVIQIVWRLGHLFACKIFIVSR